MSEFTFVADSEAATDRLGAQLADVLPPGTVVALVGTLGAGKTRLIQGVAAALGIPREEVTSPTFVLIHEYSGGRWPVYHVDAYRLRDEDEFLQLGPEEYFDGDGVTLIEWADRVEHCLPRDHLQIHMEVTGDIQRRITIRASSPALEPLVEEMKRGGL